MSNTVETIGKLKIRGYAGQHDESGASIVNEAETLMFGTPASYNFESHAEYERFAKELVRRWNSFEK